jgi:hypothetical protein
VIYSKINELEKMSKVTIVTRGTTDKVGMGHGEHFLSQVKNQRAKGTRGAICNPKAGPSRDEGQGVCSDWRQREEALFLGLG